MRCGPAEPGRRARAALPPPAAPRPPGTHLGSGAQRQRMLSPGLLTEPACAATKHGKLTTSEKRHGGPPAAQTPSSSAYPGTTTAPSGAPGGDRAKGVAAALREAPGTRARRLPRRHRGSRTRESLPDSRPSKARCVPCAQPPQPLTLATRRGGWQAENSAPVPVCANTPATATPSRGCNYTAHTVRPPARAEGMRAPVPSGSPGLPAERRGPEWRHITGALTIAARRSAPRPAPRARVSRTSYRVSVKGCQRGPGSARGTAAGVQSGRRRLLPEQRWVRLQSQLQVEDIVDDVLQDLHFADPLVGRDGGHQLPQPAVTVIHIALQAQRRRLLARRRAPLAAAVLGQAPQGRVPPAAARHAGLRLATGVPDGAHGFHGAARREGNLPLHHRRLLLLPPLRPREAAHAPPATGAERGRSASMALTAAAPGMQREPLTRAARQQRHRKPLPPPLQKK